MSHLRGVHSNDDDFSVTCGMNNCTAYYTKCSSFLSHVYRKHRELLHINCSQSEVQEVDAIPSNSDNVGAYPSLESIPSTSVPRSIEMDHAISLILGTDSLFQMETYILSLKEIYGLSEPIQFIT